MESPSKTAQLSIVSIIDALKTIAPDEKQKLITFVNASSIKTLGQFMFVSNSQLKSFGIDIKLLHKCKTEILATSKDKFSLAQLIVIKGSSQSAVPYTKEKQHIRLLTVGRSGAGKSTLINYICNYVHDIQYNDPKLYVIPDENHDCNVKEYINHSSEQGSDQTESKTQQCFTYKFENKQRIITIIDTPGYNDTRGYAQDKINIENIAKAIDTFVDINAICFVIPINDYRVNLTTKFYVSEIKKLFPKDFSNFIICITSTGSSKPEKVLASVKALGIENKYHCEFEFSPLVNKDFSCIETDYPKIWFHNGEKCEELLSVASAFPKFTSPAFKKVATARAEIKKCIIDMTEEMNAVERFNKMYETDKEQFNNLIKAIENQVDKKGPKDTCCVDCGSICHKGCMLSSVYVGIGDKELSSCACMKNDNCEKCKCARQSHYHTEYRFVAIENPHLSQASIKFADTLKITNECKNRLKDCFKKTCDGKKRRDELQELIKQKNKELEKIALLPCNQHIIDYLNNQLAIPDGTNDAEKTIIQGAIAASQKEVDLLGVSSIMV